MTDQSDGFDLDDFLPYLLNQAAEATSHGFQSTYRDRYGFSRTQWRVMANLGKFGAMTASDICTISHMEKTKVSRAVAALEQAQMLLRTRSETDRRAEVLSLTPKGQSTFAELGQLAIGFDQKLRTTLGATEAEQFASILRRLARGPSQPDDPAG